MPEFQLEERYIVIKKKHLNKAELIAINAILDAFGTPTLDCIVVEQEWPEYKPTLNAIKTRVENDNGC